MYMKVTFLRNSLFWAVRQGWFVVEVSVQPVGSMGRIGTSETSVGNYKSRCPKFQNCQYLIYTAVKAWNRELHYNYCACLFLCSVIKLRKQTFSFVMSVCPSIHQHGRTRLSLDGFSLKKKHIQIFTSIHNKFLFNTTLFCAWRHVSAAHTAIFRPAYNRTGPFLCAHNMGYIVRT